MLCPIGTAGRRAAVGGFRCCSTGMARRGAAVGGNARAGRAGVYNSLHVARYMASCIHCAKSLLDCVVQIRCTRHNPGATSTSLSVFVTW